MKEITIKVPDQKLDLVMEFIEQLGLEVSFGDFDIPEEHMDMVRERIRLSNENPERLLDWEEIKDSFKLD
ncbi:MAG: hypothetical protein WC967_04440 [Balneolaceae bacterium]